MAKSIVDVLNLLTCNLRKISNSEELELVLYDLGFSQVRKIKEENSFDFPLKNIPVQRVNNISYRYLYLLVPDKKISTPIIKMLYIDSIHGPFMVLDLFNKSISEQLAVKIGNLENFISTGVDGIYKEISSGNYILFSYYPSINLSAALISLNIELYKHPFYSWNNVIDNFSQQ